MKHKNKLVLLSGNINVTFKLFLTTIIIMALYPSSADILQKFRVVSLRLSTPAIETKRNRPPIEKELSRNN